MDVADTAAELKYWMTRASTAEAKIKDWSVRAVECEQRVRELEEQLDQEIRLYARARERIAKAKAILESGREETSSGSLWESIVAALDALEGK